MTGDTLQTKLRRNSHFIPLLGNDLTIQNSKLDLRVYCSSVPTVPLFLSAYCSCVYCSSVPLCLLFLCSSVPTVLLFLCVYCSSVPLFLCSCVYSLFLPSSVPSVPLCSLLCVCGPPCLQFLCSSVYTVPLVIINY